MTPLSQPSLENESFTPFLKNVLAKEPFQVIQLAGDASARRYYRVIQNENSWVLMVWEPFQDDDGYPFLSVHKHFAKHQITVPQIIKKSPEEGLILLEDLGDLTLERKFWENQNHELSMPFYKMAIDELIKIHYHASQDKNIKCTAFQIEFDTKKLMWEMNYGFEHLLKTLCKINLAENVKNDLYKIFNDICEKLDAQPKYICHRDYHSRNLMIKLNRLRTIDFQDARLGPIQYDLVSLVKDSYVDISRDMGKSLLEYYLEGRARAGHSKLSWEQFMEVYEIQSIQRCFKACGSFASFFNLRQDRRYLKYLPGTLQKVRQSLMLFPKYQLFLKVLADHGLFDKKFE